MMRRKTTSDEKDILIDIQSKINSTSDIKKKDAIIDEGLLLLSDEWNRRRLAKWLTNNKQQNQDTKIEAPKLIFYRGMNFTYKSQKADSFYYQCNHCKSYVTMIFLNGKFQLKNEHSCEVNLEKKKISEVHFMKSELLSKAEKILSDDPSLGPQGLYHEVLKINRKMDQNSIYITKGEVKKITEDFKQKNYSGFPDEIVNITIELNGRVTHRYLFYYTLFPSNLMIFASDYQINFLKNSSYMFVDGTFKIPSEYKNGQLFNFVVLDNQSKVFVPVIHVLMKKREKSDYDEMFSLLKNKIDFSSIKLIHSDFEVGLQKSLSENFIDAKIAGCFFHYCQALKRYIKKLYIENTSTKLLFEIFKNFPFINEFNNKIIFEALVNEKVPKLNFFLAYYQKTWLDNKFINNLNLDFKTNNPVESFHSELSRNLTNKHPSIQELVFNLKKIYISKLTKISMCTSRNEPEELKQVYNEYGIANCQAKIEEFLKTVNEFPLMLKENKKEVEVKGSKIFLKQKIKLDKYKE